MHLSDIPVRLNVVQAGFASLVVKSKSFNHKG
jgi:hypothetical protein